MATQKIKFICERCKNNTIEIYYVVGESIPRYITRMCYNCGKSRFKEENYEPRKKKDIRRA